MAVTVSGVAPGSVAEECGFEKGDVLVSLNGNEIMDVLDYRFYQDDEFLDLCVVTKDGEKVSLTVEKEEGEELGLLFDTYLMDKKHSCRNKCVFCFIDQLPKGLRRSLYFKDDDSRLSFLFGNYITLTNLTEHEIDRIIKMHISPVNISVHTTNPELRVKMMKNKNAGKALEIINRFNKAGIRMNSQLVLCPGYNDGAELERTLKDLSELSEMECIAAVPVGLTKYREGLEPLVSFDKNTAAAVIDTIEKYAGICLEKYGQRRIYASDEFYLIAERPMPPAEFYGDFPQLENGVGLWALMKQEAYAELAEIEPFTAEERTVSVATGIAAYPLLLDIARKCEEKRKGLKCSVYAVKNNFFGEKITVSGLLTATDIYDQLKDRELGNTLYISPSMLRSEGDMFLDSVTVDELSEKLGTPVCAASGGGSGLVRELLGYDLNCKEEESNG